MQTLTPTQQRHTARGQELARTEELPALLVAAANSICAHAAQVGTADAVRIITELTALFSLVTTENAPD